MKTEDQRIAIATHLGWRKEVFGPLVQDYRWHKPDGSPTHIEPPDYLNDLNAMHEAEKVLSVMYDGTDDGCECYQYIRILHEVCGGVPNCFSHHCATAAQRAEAFLRTLNLWQDAPQPEPSIEDLQEKSFNRGCS
jgi:hypothetical protein